MDKYFLLFGPLDHRKHDPLIVAKEFFNGFGVQRVFPYVVEKLSKYEGVGDEYIGCMFPNEIDASDEPFEGVEFWFLEQTLVVSLDTFKELLVFAATQYVKAHPDKREEIEKSLSKL